MPKQYGPADVFISFAGNLLSGYADGDFCSIKRNSDQQSQYVGADGEVCVVASADQSGEITITLQGSSASNDILSALHAEQEVGGVLVPKPIFVKDGKGTTLASGAEAWIKKVPDVTFGKEMSTREWVFGVARLKMQVGGNI